MRRWLAFDWRSCHLCSERLHCTRVSSSSGYIRSGIVQGSWLGPLLFLIFINDITVCFDDQVNCKLKLYLMFSAPVGVRLPIVGPFNPTCCSCLFLPTLRYPSSCVRPSHAGTVSQRLNVGSRKQHHEIAQGLLVFWRQLSLVVDALFPLKFALPRAFQRAIDEPCILPLNPPKPCSGVTAYRQGWTIPGAPRF